MFVVFLTTLYYTTSWSFFRFQMGIFFVFGVLRIYLVSCVCMYFDICSFTFFGKYTPAAASLRTSGVPSAVYSITNHQRPCTMVCMCLVVISPLDYSCRSGVFRQFHSDSIVITFLCVLFKVSFSV